MLDLDDFLARYGTEEQCFAAFRRWRWPDGFICPFCGHDRCCVLRTRRLHQCNRCRRQSSVTSNTALEFTKLPLTLWYRGLYLVTKGGRHARAAQLSRALGISYNAAWRLKRKIVGLMNDPVRPWSLEG